MRYTSGCLCGGGYHVQRVSVSKGLARDLVTEERTSFVAAFAKRCFTSAPSVPTVRDFEQVEVGVRRHEDGILVRRRGPPQHLHPTSL